MFAITFSAWTPDTWAALAAWAAVGIYLLGLGFAGIQVLQARRLREEQAWPWVVVDFDVNWLTSITIENIGSTVARDVRLAFDPPLASTMQRPWAWEESTLFRDGIPTLPPGKKITVFFDAITERFATTELPLTYKATVSFKGRQRKPRTETYVLDLAIVKGTAPPPKGLPELVDVAEKVLAEAKRWTDGGGGIRVQASNRDTIVRRRDRHVWVDRALAVLKQEGLIAFIRHLVERSLQRRGWIR